MPVCPADLWRALHSDDFPEGATFPDGSARPGILYPLFERKTLPKPGGGSRIREPDVTVREGMVQTGGGTSLFDRPNCFKGKSWRYFSIPKDTEVDPNLKIISTGYNDFFAAEHYQIEVQKPMFVAALKGALDNLARAAILKSVENARK